MSEASPAVPYGWSALPIGFANDPVTVSVEARPIAWLSAKDGSGADSARLIAAAKINFAAARCGQMSCHRCCVNLADRAGRIVSPIR